MENRRTIETVPGENQTKREHYPAWGIVSLAFLLLPVIVAPITAMTKHKTRVMCVGDSITASVVDLPGSELNRRQLGGFRRLLAKSEPSIQFVGTQHTIENKTGEKPDFDNDLHEGYPGQTIASIEAKSLPNIERLQPDFILLTCGTNNAHKGMNPNVTLEDLNRFLGEIHERSPRTRIFVSDLPPIQGNSSWDLPTWQAIQDGIPAIVSKHSSYADYEIVWRSDEKITCIDGIHPNPKGDELAAFRWAQALGLGTPD